MNQHDIDRLLSYSEQEWVELPQVEREIDTWDMIEAIVFLEEWPLAEMRLDRLAAAQQQGVLTPAQQHRYTQLLDTVQRNRPIIERLLSQ